MSDTQPELTDDTLINASSGAIPSDTEPSTVIAVLRAVEVSEGDIISSLAVGA